MQYTFRYVVISLERYFMEIRHYFLAGLLLLNAVTTSHAQNYSAVHGSNYFGSLGVYNNPATITSSPYKWDLTILGTGFTHITNAIQGKNFPLYLSPSASFDVANGTFARKADVSTNLRLLNGRFALNRNHAIAFGVNVRQSTQATTSPITYNDSVAGPRTFLFYNEQNRVVSLNMVSSAWMELYGSYAFTLWDQAASKLNVGGTIKILRGLSGAHASLDNVVIERDLGQPDELSYKITGGRANYGYSIAHGTGDSFEPGELFSKSQAGLSLDLGIEYIVKTQAVSTVYDEGEENDYEWKIGLSLLDVGLNRFVYGRESRSVSSLKNDISGAVLAEKFTSIDDLAEFNDSLATIVDRSVVLGGPFNIYTPARAVVNVDRYMWGNFYINGELSVNLLSGGKRLALQESKLLTITPRWENRKLGFYFPVQVTRHGNFWIGAAIKAGPVLFGTHNLLNALLSNKKLSGGAYLAFTIRPLEFMRDGSLKQYDCPVY
jgi:hypothetical protein